MSVKSETVVDDWEGIDDTEVSVPTFRANTMKKKDRKKLLLFIWQNNKRELSTR